MLKFEGYQIKKLQLKEDGYDNEQKDNEFGIFYKIIPNKKENFDKVNILQGIKLYPSSNNKYTIEILICGNFLIDREDKNYKDDLLKTNCGAILFPYLRCLVSLLSSQVNEKILLPTMNFYEFTKDISEEDLFDSFEAFTEF